MAEVRSGFTTKIEGLREVNRALGRVAPEARKELRAEFKKAAGVAAGTARSLAPERTGALRRSIGVKVTNRFVGLKAGTAQRVPYAGVVEFGGRHPLFGNRERWVQQRAKPFLRPAVKIHEDDVAKAAEVAITAALRKAGLL